MTRFVVLVFATLITTVTTIAPAGAATDLETQLKAALGKAVAMSIFSDMDAARKACNAGKALLKANSPKYLAAYVEACFASAAAPAGPGNEKPRCPYYLRAIEIWRTSPLPMDDEDEALYRAQILNTWKYVAAKDCGAPALAVRTDMGPITPVAPGSRLETEEGVSYLVPEGWTVERFFEISGSATLKDAAHGYFMEVSRKGPKDNVAYTNTETLPSGLTLQWKYAEWLPKSGAYVISSRVKLSGAYLNMYVSGGVNAVDKNIGLQAVREVADGARIISPRRCIDNCGPGKIVSN